MRQILFFVITHAFTHRGFEFNITFKTDFKKKFNVMGYKSHANEKCSLKENDIILWG